MGSHSSIRSTQSTQSAQQQTVQCTRNGSYESPLHEMAPARTLSSAPAAPEAVGMLPEVKITIHENDKRVSVPAGGSFSITLKENPTTGYVWTVTQTSRSLGYPSPLKGLFRRDQAAEGMTGVGGKHTFTWDLTRNSGTTIGSEHHIGLTHQRSWEPDGLSTPFNVTVVIVEPSSLEHP